MLPMCKEYVLVESNCKIIVYLVPRTCLGYDDLQFFFAGNFPLCLSYIWKDSYELSARSLELDWFIKCMEDKQPLLWICLQEGDGESCELY